MQEFSQYGFYMQPRTHLILDQVGHVISAWPDIPRHVLQCYLAQLLRCMAVPREEMARLCRRRSPVACLLADCVAPERTVSHEDALAAEFSLHQQLSSYLSAGT